MWPVLGARGGSFEQARLDPAPPEGPTMDKEPRQGSNRGASTMSKPSLRLLFLVFTASGFSCLIYESLWTHYLKLFLGHAAYAQTLVLAIFMGGMAIGSWVCGRWSARWANLLRGYALAEGVIGLFALAFHIVFDRSVNLAYEAI